MKLRKRFGVVLVLAMLVSVLAMTMTASAAKKTKISKKSATVAAGQTVKLSVKNAKGKKVKWSSDDTDVAKVSNGGTVTGVSGGLATISAKVGGKTYKCKVTVEAVKFANMSVLEPVIDLTGSYNDKDGNVQAGRKTYDLKPHLTTYPAGLAVKWASSNEKVATVKDGVVTAVANGTVSISAEATDGSGAVDNVVFHVTGLGEFDNTDPIVITNNNFSAVFAKYFTKVKCTEYWTDKDGKILTPGTTYAYIKDGKQMTDGVSYGLIDYYFYVVTNPNVDVFKSVGTASSFSLRYNYNKNLADIVSKSLPVTSNKKKIITDEYIMQLSHQEFPKDECEAIFYKDSKGKTCEGKHYKAQYNTAGVAGKDLLYFEYGNELETYITGAPGAWMYNTISDETFTSLYAVLYKKA